MGVFIYLLYKSQLSSQFEQTQLYLHLIVFEQYY